MNPDDTRDPDNTHPAGIVFGVFLTVLAFIILGLIGLAMMFHSISAG